MSFALQRLCYGLRSSHGRAASSARRGGACAGAFRRSLRRLATPRQPNAGPACLREPDRYRLLCGSRTVFAFTDVMDLLTNELASLCRRCFALAFVPTGSLYRFFFWHLLLLRAVIAIPFGGIGARSAPLMRACAG